jgi:hypothetical protein
MSVNSTFALLGREVYFFGFVIITGEYITQVYIILQVACGLLAGATMLKSITPHFPSLSARRSDTSSIIIRSLASCFVEFFLGTSDLASRCRCCLCTTFCVRIAVFKTENFTYAIIVILDNKISNLWRCN